MVLIFGKRSNLSKALGKSIEDAILLSSKENFEEIISALRLKKENVQIIFNNFQASTDLYDIKNLDNYIENSIFNTARILTMLEKNNIVIDKIIYTSSSSVYGNNKFCSEIDSVMPTSLQAALKVSNEELIKRFCEARNIDYTIARVFNMYGGEDKFSVISKIKYAYINKRSLNIINGGTSIRDYICINDVINVYLQLLKIKKLPKILNIASGNGNRVYDILNFLKLEGLQIQTVNTQRDELKASIANTDLLNTIIGTTDFIKVEDYLLKELKK